MFEVTKKKKVKIQKLQGLKTKGYCFYQNEQYVIVKKSRFIIKQETGRLLSSLEWKTPFSKIALLADISLYKV